MGIIELCQTIQNTITNYTRKPFMALSGLIMVCSLAKRPGLSTILSTANIIKNIAAEGIKTDQMDDGERNFLNVYTKAVVSEIFRALQDDANVQIALGPGAMMSVGTGGNAGGPVVVTSNNVNYVKGCGQIN